MLFLKGVNSPTLFGKRLAMAAKTLTFFIASDLLGSRYSLFPFHCLADRLVEVKNLVQDHTTGN